MNDCSIVNSILVPIGCTSRVTHSEPLGIWDWAADHVTWLVLIVSSSTAVRSSAESRVTEVWQKVSMARLIRR